MDMTFKSTRGDSKCFTASEAVIKGLADDGGLFVPSYFPKLSCELSELVDKNYKEIAFLVMKEFFADYTEEELKECIDKAYDSKFDTKQIAPLVSAGDNNILELFHGPTIAFKDMALSILPYLMITALKKNHITDKVIILTATSGDTGKAALAAFSDVPGTGIIVFYPKGGVSKIQELQMVTQKGDNTDVVAVEGNFDDCQTCVKELFHDEELAKLIAKKGYRFSSANSINIGRLFPQVAYYVYAYAKMVEIGKIEVGETINFTVPTGNFGNILAAFYAKQMGIPVGKLICASNDNKVLYDFFKTGTYDKNRSFILTASPSMDILISSNLERLIYHSCKNDAAKNAGFMNNLANNGVYTIDEHMRDYMCDFAGEYAREDSVFDTIRDYYEKTGYVLDTHTAVAAYADKEYKRKSKDTTESVIVSTASPYKFTRNVLKAIAPKEAEREDDFELVDKLSELSHITVPPAIEEIRNAPVKHKRVCAVDDMKQTVCEILGV